MWVATNKGLNMSEACVKAMLCLLPTPSLRSLAADLPASAVGRVRVQGPGVGLLRGVQRDGLQDRLRDALHRGELQLQDGAHAR